MTAAWNEANDELPTTPRPDRLGLLARILRMAGSLAVVAGVSVFLFQHWEQGSDLERYLILLAQSVSIALVGLACGFALRDAKGARTLLALALLSVPVQFTILGSFVYSHVAPFAAALAPVPAFATWLAPSPNALVATLAGAGAALTALSAFSFSVLARERARLLTAAFLGANALLLLPLRDGDWLALAVGSAIAALAWLVRGPLAHGAETRTLEGGYARAMLFAPPLLIAARSIGFYEASQLLYGVLVASASFTAFQAPRWLRCERAARDGWHAMGVSLAGGAWWLFAAALDRMLELPSGLLLPLLTLPFAAFLTTLSFRLADSGPVYRRIASGIAVAGSLANLAVDAGALGGLLALVTGAAVLAYGFLLQQRIVFALGAVALLGGIAAQVRLAIDLYSLPHALALGLAGVSIIVAASLLERYHARLFAWAGQVRDDMRTWEN